MLNKSKICTCQTCPIHNKFKNILFGNDYWKMLEKNSKIVDSWPDWKKGSPINVRKT